MMMSEKELVEWRSDRGNKSTRRKPAPVPLRPPQIPHDLTHAVGSQGLTSRSVAQKLGFQSSLSAPGFEGPHRFTWGEICISELITVTFKSNKMHLTFKRTGSKKKQWTQFLIREWSWTWPYNRNRLTTVGPWLYMYVLVHHLGSKCYIPLFPSKYHLRNFIS
jgi:hypothetical protein